MVLGLFPWSTRRPPCYHKPAQVQTNHHPAGPIDLSELAGERGALFDPGETGFGPRDPLGNPSSAPKHPTLELQPKASPERFLITGLGAVAGYMLCGVILRMIGPSSDESVIRLFSVLAGVLFAAVAWKIG